MASPRRQSGLGRGLDALLGDAPARPTSGPENDGAADAPGPQAAPARGPVTLPIAFLRPNPDQPRRIFAEAEIDELAHSIRMRGILQPILVRPVGPDAYEIVAGERRWRAAQKAQLHEAPVIIRALSDDAAAEIALIENVQRVDLSPLEEARAYQRLADVHKRTQDEIARAVGKSRAHVANQMRLLGLETPVREALERAEITAGHARALIGAPDAATLLKIVIAKRLNVRDTETLVRAAHDRASEQGRGGGDGGRDGGEGRSKRAGDGKSSAGGRKDADARALEADLAAALGLEVSLAHRPNGAGTLEIHYRDLDQLDEVCRRLTGARI